MAVASGLCAGGNYFNQPLLHSIAVDLDVTEATVALTVTLAQVAYACGLLLLVPLGDMLERRAAAVTLMLLAAAGQFISGFASGIVMLSAGIAMAGLFSVAAQILVPLAAILSDPRRSGRAVGIVMSGLLTGILTARSVAGLLSAWGGWTTIYRVSGVAMVGVAVALWFALPTSRNPSRVRYADTLRSLYTLLRAHPRLRSRALLGALSFSSVSVLFSTMALLLSGPSHGMSEAGIGLVGLAGVAGALMASVAGRLADRGWVQTTTAVSVLLIASSWCALWLGATSLVWFLAGVLLIDLALQGVHINNQHVVFKLEAEARSRLNAVYMTGYFIGAAGGSALGSLAWHFGGWPATCVTGGVLGMLGAVALLHDRRVEQRSERGVTSRPPSGDACGVARDASR
jgi:predicted MFS family arabinose efflux permease